MPDQPAHILNSTIGYDYMGFSIRLSYLYQSDKVTGIGTIPLLDSYTGAYERWDIAIQQRLSDNIQIYVNLNNLNDSYDKSLQGYQEIDPTSLAYYGRTIDAGVRINF
jgi:outer membrane receptor protein involved in Fe transport